MKLRDRDKLRGHIEPMVLAALERGAAHGFEIMQRLNAEGQGLFHLKEGTLYPILYRLEREGLLKAAWDESGPRKGPRRRIYRLSPKGTKRLKDHRAEWQNFVAVVGSIVGA